MKEVFDYGQFFMQHDVSGNKHEESEKLPMLLYLANLICMAEYGELLFNNNRNESLVLKENGGMYQLAFTAKELNVLQLTANIFGHASVQELSEISQAFNYAKQDFLDNVIFKEYDKNSSINAISNTEDIQSMKEIICAYREAQNDLSKKEIVNGITFYCDDVDLTEEVMKQLKDFSLFAEDDTYCVYLDDDRLVIY